MTNLFVRKFSLILVFMNQGHEINMFFFQPTFVVQSVDTQLVVVEPSTFTANSSMIR